MEEIARNVAMAREYALCNNYETASIMMQSMVVELSQYIRGCQDERTKGLAKRLYEACQAEVKLINDLLRETSPAALDPPLPVRGHHPGLARDDLYVNGSNDPHDYVVRRPAPRPAEDEAEWGFDDRRPGGGGGGGGRPGWDPTPGTWDPNPPVPPRRPLAMA
eukprot:EG_transcript_35504